MTHRTLFLSLALVAGLAQARAPHAAASAPVAAPVAAAAPADAASRPGTPQRTRMKTCNADARTRDLHGDPRRAFMKQCLSGKPRPADLF
jgi:hypothetical protein